MPVFHSKTSLKLLPRSSFNGRSAILDNFTNMTRIFQAQCVYSLTWTQQMLFLQQVLFLSSWKSHFSFLLAYHEWYYYWLILFVGHEMCWFSGYTYLLNKYSLRNCWLQIIIAENNGENNDDYD